MNQNQQEPTLEESVKQVMRTLPPPIRDYLSRGKYTSVAKEMMATYGLRIDQCGILERGMMLLLMGIDDPAEFSKSLIEEAKLDQRTVNNIMQDINTEIFVPLRDEIRKGPAVEPEAAKPPASQSPKPPVPATLQGAAATPRPLPTGVKPPQVLVPAPPSQKPALRDVLSSVMKAPPTSVTSTHSSTIIPASVTLPPTVPTPIPAPAAMIPPAPPRAAPPENLPGAPRASQAAPIAPASESRTEPPKPPIAPAVPTKPYSVDPYREPVDEK